MKYKEIEFGRTDIEVIDGDRGKKYPHQNELLNNGFCVFLSASNVTVSGFKFDSVVYITKEKDEQLRNGKLSRNDIVITTRGTVGNVAFSSESSCEHYLKFQPPLTQIA
jgi:type I restriction enzyme S subunit